MHARDVWAPRQQQPSWDVEERVAESGDANPIPRGTTTVEAEVDFDAEGSAP
jgi:hypothetical protein